MLKIRESINEFPVVQAALSGYSDLAMRRIARRHGAGLTHTEVLLDQTILTTGKRQKRALGVEADDHPVVAQLMGCEPDELARAATVVLEAGHDAVDLNFACPVRKVLRRGRGGQLLQDPKLAEAILKQVCAAVAGQCEVTLKLRRAYDETPESQARFFEIFETAASLGIAAITIHPRTVVQRYVGASDWAFLTRLKADYPDQLIIGSGDLFNPEDCLRMLDETGVDGVSAARGCIGNPWFFRDCRALLAGEPLPELPTVPEQGQTIERHYRELVGLYGESRAGRLMRKFGIRYSRLHPHALQVRDAFIKLRRTEELQQLLGRWYDPETHWPPATRLTDPDDLIAPGAMREA